MRNAAQAAAAWFLTHVATHEPTIALDSERFKAGVKGIIHADVSFSPNFFTRRLNALGFSIQLLEFVQNPAEGLEF